MINTLLFESFTDISIHTSDRLITAKPPKTKRYKATHEDISKAKNDQDNEDYILEIVDVVKVDNDSEEELSLRVKWKFESFQDEPFLLIYEQSPDLVEKFISINEHLREIVDKELLKRKQPSSNKKKRRPVGDALKPTDEETSKKKRRRAPKNGNHVNKKERKGKNSRIIKKRKISHKNDAVDDNNKDEAIHDENNNDDANHDKNKHDEAIHDKDKDEATIDDKNKDDDAIEHNNKDDDAIDDERKDDDAINYNKKDDDAMDDKNKDDQDTEAETTYICENNHFSIDDMKEEHRALYFEEGRVYHGVKCEKCQNVIKLTSLKQPVYCCKNETKSCRKCVCSACMKSILFASPAKRFRRSNFTVDKKDLF